MSTLPLVTHLIPVAEVGADAVVAVLLDPCGSTTDRAPSSSLVTVSATKKRGELSRNGMSQQAVVLSLLMGA